MPPIAVLKQSLAAVLASMDGLMTAAASSDNRDLTAEEQTAFDAHLANAEKIEGQIKTAERMLALKASAAAPVVVDTPSVPAAPKQKLEAGIMVGRIAMAIGATGGNDQRAMAAHAEQVWGSDMGEIVGNMEQQTAVKGGYLVDTAYSKEFLDLLRPKVVIRSLGARSVPMPEGNLTTRKKTAGTTAGYVGERTPAPTTDMQVGTNSMSAKKLMALVPITNQLLRRSSMGVDALVRDDLITSAAVKEDQQFLRGQGSALAPAGARYLVNAANVSAMTANPSLLTVSADLSRLMLMVRNANIPMASVGWIMSPTSREFLANLRDGNGNLVYPSIDATGTLRGYKIADTTSVPINLGASGKESEVYFGDWAQFQIGDTYQVTLAASTEAAYDDGGVIRAAFSNDETVIRLIEEHDTQLAYDQAISVLTGVTWGQ